MQASEWQGANKQWQHNYESTDTDNKTKQLGEQEQVQRNE